MATISIWHDVEDDDEELFAPPEHDPLGVLGSTRWVVEQGERVWINIDRVKLLSEQWAEEDSAPQTPQWYDRYHFFDGTQRSVNWLLLLDALNFCFWAEKGQPRWTIDYHGEKLNGYWAEAAALTRAVEEGLPLWDAEYLSTISEETMAHIFRGEQSIPLFEQRVANAREAGRVLLDHFDGQFSQAIEQAGGSAVALVLLLAERFPSFHDVACYRQREVRFLKRAQICVADLHGAFKGKSWGAFTGLEHLTAFADYKLPQVLRQYGVIEYQASLAAHVDAQELIAPGSEEEIEIRAATVWACEMLRRALLKQGRSMTAPEIDQRLWFISQNLNEARPYHRTRTIYY
ncbi:MAG TPA: queuosine salvage family protein [Ktedonobacteraceae bacterium]|jgi:hypothetical protein|nr:queuosine salvage family protein [Ktedonobacteraceae bacterium]